ncbi:MAG: substrate-binding domain-containing protein [Betaproteobacteria bacterium]|nr:substrate-binding domain-containing protein [Betaproteobacteria bacterium]
MTKLIWPEEQVRAGGAPGFSQADSNICLDFHGDPARARLVVFSDGNHHMALREALELFADLYPDVGDIFYITTPPRVAVEMLQAGRILVGNLGITATPHVFISPPQILERLVDGGYMQAHSPFMRSRGNVLLVRKGNPKNILGVADLLRDGVRLFLSNPVTETLSYQVYADSLRNLAQRDGINLAFLEHAPGKHDPARLMYGNLVHHREAPQALADGKVDVAMLYYHLALRYQRIFPEMFEMIEIVGIGNDNAANDDPLNIISQFNCGLVGDGGEWGATLLDHLMSATVAEIYVKHGLTRAV